MSQKTEQYRAHIKKLSDREADICFRIRELTAQLRETRSEKAETYAKLGKASSGKNEIKHHNEENPLENIDLAFTIVHEDEPDAPLEICTPEAITA